jgi:hypothetical protein
MIEKLTTQQKLVLARIQNSIPKLWIDNVLTKVKAYPALIEIVEKGLSDSEVSQEVKDKLKLIQNNDELYKEIEIENPKYTKLIDKYTQREINKAIKRGELPKQKNDKNKK